MVHVALDRFGGKQAIPDPVFFRDRGSEAFSISRLTLSSNIALAKIKRLLCRTGSGPSRMLCMNPGFRKELAVSVMVLISSFLFFVAVKLHAIETDTEISPHFDMSIRPISLDCPSFAIKGSIAIPGTGKKIVNLSMMPGLKYKFAVNGSEVVPDEKNVITLECNPMNPESRLIRFEGNSQIQNPKCQAFGDELFCLNNCPPNPEILTDGSSRYKIRFDLPTGYQAITFDSEIPSSIGIQFHIAKFQKPILRKSANFTFEYFFPEGFKAEEQYFDFLEKTLEDRRMYFGDLGFKLIRVGAIRRGEEKGEISGSPYAK